MFFLIAIDFIFSFISQKFNTKLYELTWFQKSSDNNTKGNNRLISVFSYKGEFYAIPLNDKLHK